jgi:hypothetical protein
MRLPSLQKVDHLGPLTIPLHGLHAMALSSAEERFRLKGEHPPMFLIAAGTDVAWVEETWDSGAERGFKLALMRQLLQVMDARAYTFISEVYVATITFEEIERFGMPTVPPSQMPTGNRRDEMLWIDSWDRQGGHYLSKYLITPRRPLPFLGPRQDETDHDDEEFVGRAANLFQPPREGPL